MATQIKKTKKKKCFWSWQHVSFFFLFHYFDQSEILTFKIPCPLSLPLTLQIHRRPQLRKPPPLTSSLRRPFINSPSTAPLSFWVSPSPLSLFISLLSLGDRIFSLEYEYMCVNMILIIEMEMWFRGFVYLCDWFLGFDGFTIFSLCNLQESKSNLVGTEKFLHRLKWSRQPNVIKNGQCIHFSLMGVY